METPLTTRAALLQALRDGPGYGRELIERVARLTQGRLRLSDARVYPVLRSLQAASLVRTSRVTPGGRRGARMRTYYDLTVRGVEASSAERSVLRALVARASPSPPKAELARMARRLAEAEDLAAIGEELHAGVSKSRRG